MDWLYDHLVTILVLIVAVIYVTAWRTLAPRKESLKDAKFGPETDYYDQVANCDPYSDHRWVPAPMAFNGTCAADFSIVEKKSTPEYQAEMARMRDHVKFVIPNRDPYPFEKVDTVDKDDPIESNECCAISYTELMSRLRTGTIVPADMPPKLPVDFEMLLHMVMAMIDTNERKGDAQTCDRVFTLLRRRYDATSLNTVPESRYLELWVDLKQLERLRG